MSVGATMDRDRRTYEDLYVAQGLGVREVASRVGVSPTTVLVDMRRLGIERRPQQRHPSLRRDFFDVIDTSEKAYLLGLVWADGTIDRSTMQVRVRLADVDRADMERMACVVGLSHLAEVLASGNAQQPQVGLVMSSHRMVAALCDLGMTEAKDYTLPAATLPEASLMRDFVRGLVDGDGCLTWAGEHKSTPRVSFKNRNTSLRAAVAGYWRQVSGEESRLDGDSIYLSAAATRLACSDMYREGDLCLARKLKLARLFCCEPPN